ncbi:Unknown protein [Striga hermonthica]|uniref:DUF4216 domain-containing protein n=1 Tax=Striga hermonthica TaxID=68872 RepID=A0A9N7ML52_STRHE|nr:Unknown protein [Striga hermonthica]
MVLDAMGPELYRAYHEDSGEEVPNPNAEEFFRLLEEVDRPLWPGCNKQTKLSATSQLLNLFANSGRPIGSQSSNLKLLTSEEHKAVTLYVLLNCQEIAPFVTEFDNFIRTERPSISERELDHLRESHFPRWLRDFVSDDKNEIDNRVRDMAMGPSRNVRSYNGYYVNGYKFHTHCHGLTKATQNSGVCVLGSCYNEFEVDYYGVLTEILELEYIGSNNRVTLFKCDWFDNEKGVKVHPIFNLVEINHKKKLLSTDVYVLAQQAQQVYYTSFPSASKDKQYVWAVVKTKARHVIDVRGVVPENKDFSVVDDLAFQEESPINNIPLVPISPELDNEEIVQGGDYFEEVDKVELEKVNEDDMVSESGESSEEYDSTKIAEGFEFGSASSESDG